MLALNDLRQVVLGLRRGPAAAAGAARARQQRGARAQGWGGGAPDTRPWPAQSHETPHVAKL